MKSLDDSNREEALKYVVDLYTKFLGEPDGDVGKDLRQVHLKQMNKFTRMFNRKDEAYLIKEGLRRQSNDMEELEKALKLRAENTELLGKGTRTKAPDVVTLDMPEMFQPKKEKKSDKCSETNASKKDDADDEDFDLYGDDEPENENDDDYEPEEENIDNEEEEEEESTFSPGTTLSKTKTSSTSSGIIGKHSLSNDELIANIKKIKGIKDDLLYPTIESLILQNNIELSTSLQEKLEYLGFDGYDEFIITNTTDVELLTKDVINTFMFIDLNNEPDVEKLKFVINKIPQLNEWNEFFIK